MIRPLYSTPDNPDRDLIGKRADYAEGRIPEYWIVDPRDESITVLTFPPDGGDDAEYGVFRAGEQASSKLFDGFAVDVSATFAATRRRVK